MATATAVVSATVLSGRPSSSDPSCPLALTTDGVSMRATGPAPSRAGGVAFVRLPLCPAPLGFSFGITQLSGLYVTEPTEG